MSEKKNTDAVLVLGGGVAGIHSALQLADEGYYVYLVEKKSTIGGMMPQLSRTFGECFCCKIYPQAYGCLWNPNIEILTLSEVEKISGKAGDFTVTLSRKARFVNEDACNACGKCVSVCPVDVSDSSAFQTEKRKAIYIEHPFAVPMTYTVDPDHCSFIRDGSCGDCVKACPAEAIDLKAKQTKKKLNVGAIVMAPGFNLFDPGRNQIFAYGQPNVITGKEFERMASALGITNGQVVRPSDGEVPRKVAWVLCVGSRDINKSDNPHCSAVCCMYSLKEAYEMKKRLGDEFEATLFYMDIRAFGKGWEEYYNEAKEAGINLVRCRIHTVTPVQNDNLEITYMDSSGELKKDEFDMVVLATGMETPEECVELAEKTKINLAQGKFADTSSFAPTQTSVPGIFVAGTFQAPKDIYDSITDARAAANNVTKILAKSASETESPESSTQASQAQEVSIGVFFIPFPWQAFTEDDLKTLADYASGLPNVKTVITDFSHMNPKKYLDTIREKITGEALNRIVIVSSLPDVHEGAVKRVMSEAGLSPLMLEVVDLRDTYSCGAERCSEKQLDTIKSLINTGIARANLMEQHEPLTFPFNSNALVVGGGVAGMVASLNLAEQGFDVFLVERSDRLGGNALSINTTWKNEDVGAYLQELISKVEKSEKITLFMESEVKSVKGSAGDFESVIVKKGSTETINHGVAIIATGASEYKPSEYLYGENNKVITLLELDEKLKKKPDDLKKAKSVTFIQCVGSREPERPYCSRVCCTHSVENALKLKEINPEMDIFVLYRQMRTYGLREQILLNARHQKVRFIQFDVNEKPEVKAGKNKLKIVVRDPILGKKVEIESDLLVLASAIVPNDNTALSRLFHVPVNENGFFRETKDEGLRFSGARVEGVFFCGLSHYPKSLDETIVQAEAVAGQAAVLLKQGTYRVEKQVAVVNPDFCAVCCTCVRTCPYEVPYIGEDAYSVIDPVRCMGCGACVTECPGKAITLQNFSDKQVFAQIDALLSA